LYGARVRDFPKEYELQSSLLDYRNDPYCRDKFKVKRIDLKGAFAFLAFAFLCVKFREA
jgi:hypothetical protein